MIVERAIPPGPELRAIWPWVKERLEKVADKSRDNWMSEDVWASLRLGNSTLFVCALDGTDVGFVICQKQMGYDGPVLFIWACWFEAMRYRKHVNELLPILDRHARSIGAREIRHHSNRLGWSGGGDFERHSIIWSRKVKEKEWTTAAAVAALKP